jgi:hypothetical protein
MSDVKKLSLVAQETFYKFFDGDISPLEFEKLIFENSEIESCIGA